MVMVCYIQNNFFGVVGIGVLDQFIQVGNQCFVIFEVKVFDVGVMGIEVFFKFFCCGQLFKQVFVGVGFVFRMGLYWFYVLLELMFDVGIDDVYVFGIDVFVVGVVQVINDVFEFYGFGVEIQ